MSAALALPVAFPPDPVPSPERQPSHAPAANNTTRLLTLLRWLIGYGTNLAAAFPRRFAGPDRNMFAYRFHTTDIAHILARFARALMVATALEAFLAKRAARGRDTAQTPVRFPPLVRTPPGDTSAPRARHTNIIDFPLDRPPTEAEIAAEIRRRKPGAIIADICRDLGIRPGDMDADEWQELSRAVICHGGRIVTMLFGGERVRLRAMVEARCAEYAAGPPAAVPPAAVPAATGPP